MMSTRLQQFATFWLAISLTPSMAIGQDAEEEGWDEPAFQRWQVYYQQIASEYEIYADESPDERLRVTPESLFSYKYPQQFRKSHGAFFIWSHQQRPYAIGCIWSQLEPYGVRTVVHELHSLAPGGLKGKWKTDVSWRPRESGVEFKPIAGVDGPPATSAQCFERIREIAKPFDGITRREENRPLIVYPKPLYQYQNPEIGILAGSVFGLFDGRDAEIVLLIEARQNGEQRHWEYAAVPFSEVAVVLQYSGDEVWSAPARTYSNPTKPFYAPRPASHAPGLEDFEFEKPDMKETEAGVILDERRDQ